MNKKIKNFVKDAPSKDVYWVVLYSYHLVAFRHWHDQVSLQYAGQFSDGNCVLWRSNMVYK